MSFRLVIQPRASQEAEEAAIWYEKQRKGLGKEFVRELDFGIVSILHNPYKFEVLRNEFRRKVVKRFPFGIFFRIDNDTVIIVAIWHFKRKPFGWVRK